MKSAVYPGTFDPITNGHLDILKQALIIFDRVVIAVAPNVSKSPLFSLEERLQMIRQSIDKQNGVEVISSEGLTVELARQVKVQAIIRGIRTGEDLAAENQMALMNRHLAPELTTIAFFPGEPFAYVSSSLIKEVHKFGGDITHHVPPAVVKALEEKRGK
ncbi:MAG: pantetheine-phosphate adenylyltransferase [Gemmatimonadota bacterium]|jgi:pantetheine-phosphate adenylyltransferase|nr:pantetheine-phosphate adenylyltransferase [Gemmatimonadota bacterium]HCQ00997.1 pantetheine-phosphate adenylyltransferase [Candidatus Latescibacterota bacterium]